MGYVQKASNGTGFRARTRVNGKLVSKTLKTQSLAWSWLEKTEGDGESEASSEPTPGTRAASTGITVAQFIASAMVTANLRESTAATYRFADGHLVRKFGTRDIATVEHLELQRWLLTDVVAGRAQKTKDGKKKDLSRATIKTVSKRTHQIFKRAKRLGYIVENPAEELILPRDQTPFEPRFIERVELERLAAELDGRFSVFAYLAGMGGLRIGEAFGLRWRYVDLSTGRVQIRECVAEVDGHLVLGPPKTETSRRDVVLPRVARQALVAHRARLHAAGGDTRPDAWVIPNLDGWPVDGGPKPKSAPMSGVNFRKRFWHPAVKVSGLTPLRPHDLRHTAISMWIAAGMNPKQVSTRAGHSSVSFTLDVYGHLFPDDDEKQASIFDQYLDETEPEAPTA